MIAILQGLVFAVLLVIRGVRRRSIADFWLALLLYSLCSTLVTPMIGFANVYDLNQWLTYFPFSIVYIYGSCVWLYTISLTDARRGFRTADLRYFVPSVIYLAIRFFLFAQSLEWKRWFDDNYGPLFSAIIFVTELVWNIALLSLSIRHYRRYRLWLDDNYSDSERIKFDWLRTFLYFFTAVVVLGAIFDFTNSFIKKLSYIQIFYFELVLAFATYALAVAGYLRSKTIEPTFDPALEEESATPAAEKDIEPLKSRLEQLMRDEKLYREPNLTLADIARRLAVNSSLVSAAINGGFGKNFNDFVNEYRIDEVKSRLRDGAAQESTLLAVALDSGFNSKATFNRAFKKFTGVAPREFQNAPE